MSVASKRITPVDPSEVKAGDLMAFTYWGNVEKVEHSLDGRQLQLKDIDSGTKFFVSGNSLIENSRSSEQFHTRTKVTKTQIVEILANAHHTPFTVTFVKADGTTRVLRGRLIGVDQKNLGYIDVEDLDKPVGRRFRLVDCRTIKSLIVDGVKYTV